MVAYPTRLFLIIFWKAFLDSIESDCLQKIEGNFKSKNHKYIVGKYI